MTGSNIFIGVMFVLYTNSSRAECLSDFAVWYKSDREYETKYLHVDNFRPDVTIMLAFLSHICYDMVLIFMSSEKRCGVALTKKNHHSKTWGGCTWHSLPYFQMLLDWVNCLDNSLPCCVVTLSMGWCKHTAVWLAVNHTSDAVDKTCNINVKCLISSEPADNQSGLPTTSKLYCVLLNTTVGMEYLSNFYRWLLISLFLPLFPLTSHLTTPGSSFI